MVVWSATLLGSRPLQTGPVRVRLDTSKGAILMAVHRDWAPRGADRFLELVKAGYIVLSTTHPGTSGEDQTAAGRYRLWDRSRDHPISPTRDPSQA